MTQKEQLATQEQKLEALTLKIEDVETLLEDVSGAAYDKAVEVAVSYTHLSLIPNIPGCTGSAP